MTDQQPLTFAQFAEHLSELLGEGYPGELRPEMSLVDEIGLDSFDVFDLIVLVEDLSGTTVSLDNPPVMSTVQDLYAFYRSALPGRSGPLNVTISR